MKIEKLSADKKNFKVSFLLKDSSDVFANSIRRLILEEVPTLAVEDVEIRDNNSALYDEMIALRLGLTPIKTDLKSYNLQEKCKCESVGCAQCQLKITLKASKKGNVVAADAQSADPKCSFVHENMPIVKLLAKQKIDVTMTAVLGKGKNHIKWAPGLAFYKPEPVVKVGKVKDAKKVADNCPDKVFTLKGDKLELNQKNVYNSKLLDYYAELDEGITVEYTDNVIFNLESWGQLSCKEILTQASTILLQKAEEMESLL